MSCIIEDFKLDSSAFALLFTEISVIHTTEISVKSSAKAEESSFNVDHLTKFLVPLRENTLYFLCAKREIKTKLFL